MGQIIPSLSLDNYQEIKLKFPFSAFEAFKRLYPYCQNLFLLESLGEGGKYNRYSYLGFDSAVTVVARGKEIFINGRSQKVGNPYATLSSLLSVRKGQSPSLSQGFCGGLVGYLTYEATKYFEPAFVGSSQHEFKEFQFGFYLDGLLFDKKANRCSYFYYKKNRLKEILSFINRPNRLGKFKFQKLPSFLSPVKHRQMVSRAKQSIKRGDIFQVVLSLKSNFRLLGDKRRIYAFIRQVNPAPYMAYLKFGDCEIISASPELLIHVQGEKIEHLGTLAGTSSRGKTPAEDESLAKKLLASEKEKAEHMMLVDLARNDLGKICEFGSLRVENLLSVKRFQYVQHLSSEIYGKLKTGENSLSALAACFPAGTVTGAPKVEAMKIINELEGEARGPYAGVIGYASLSGEAMWAIAIRSLFIKGDTGYTQTGSGIVLDSHPQLEYQEILVKQKGIEEALKQATV